MTMKDGIKLGIGFQIGWILLNGTSNVLKSFVYPKLYREMKKTNIWIEFVRVKKR